MKLIELFPLIEWPKVNVYEKKIDALINMKEFI